MVPWTVRERGVVNQPKRPYRNGRPELTRARKRHGLTQEEAAELVGVSTTTWARWERGEQDLRPVYRARLAEAWQVGPAEVERWLEPASSPQHPGDGGEDTVDLAGGGLDRVDQLWRWEMDASRRHLLAVLPFVPGLLGEWLLAWRYDNISGSATRAASPGASAHRVTVGWADVQRVHEAHQAFAQMDHQFGAGLVRPAVTDFMNTTLAPLLRGRYREDVGRALMSAAARMARTAGWMAFDLGAHGQAQQHLGQALKLAKHAQDVLTGAWILATLAQQACDLNQGRWAIRLAGAAAEAGQHGQASPRVMAFLHLRHARALAVAADTGDASEPDTHARRQVEELLTQVEDTYTPRTRDEDPAWITTFGPAELAAEVGYCCQRIGQHQRAADYADQALSRFTGGYLRSIHFNQIHAAQAHLALGDLDSALAYARPAIRSAKELSSARATAHVRDFARSLTPHRARNSDVRDFQDYLKTELGA